MIFETLLPSRVVDRPPKKISRALSDREIQPLDERSVQFRGVLGVAQIPDLRNRLDDCGTSRTTYAFSVRSFLGSHHLQPRLCCRSHSESGQPLPSTLCLIMSFGARFRYIRLAKNVSVRQARQTNPKETENRER